VRKNKNVVVEKNYRVIYTTDILVVKKREGGLLKQKYLWLCEKGGEKHIC